MSRKLQKMFAEQNHPIYRLPTPDGGLSTPDWWAKVRGFLEYELRTAFSEGYASGAAEKGKRIHEAWERFIKENGLENDNG